MKRSLTVFAFTGLVLATNAALADSNVDIDPYWKHPQELVSVERGHQPQAPVASDANSTAERDRVINGYNN